MKVLLDLSPVGSNPTSRTGLARVALTLANALARRDDVEIFACAWGSVYASADFSRAAGEFVGLSVLPFQPNHLETLYLRLYANALCGNGRMPTWLIRMGQILNQIRDPLRDVDAGAFDLTHSTYARFPCVIRGKMPNRVLTIHDLTAFKLDPALVPGGQLAITRRIVESVRPDDWVACISEATRRDFLEHTGHPVERTVVIPNAVDHAVFRPMPDPAQLDAVRRRCGLPEAPYVFTLSSLAPHKNLKLLLQAWPEVRRRQPEAVFVIAGGKTKNIAELQAKLGGDFGPLEGVILTGFVPDEDFATLASGCQAFLFPTLYEGFGLPVLEAMACGAPVIASDRSSVPEVVGEAGTLLDPEDGEAWIEAIVRALGQPDRQLQPSKAQLARAQQFTWDGVAGQYVDLYRKMLAEGE